MSSISIVCVTPPDLVEYAWVCAAIKGSWREGLCDVVARQSWRRETTACFMIYWDVFRLSRWNVKQRDNPSGDRV